MEKAVCYLRVSTEEQARHGVSLAAQEEKLLAYCRLSSLEPVAMLREEGVSGSKPLGARTGDAELLKQVTRKEVKHVVAMKLDRLFRDAADALNQTKAWDKAGVALHLVDMGGQALNTSTAMGRFFLGMMSSFAELERNLIAERTSTALTHKKRHREAYGPTPYGFDREGRELPAAEQPLRGGLNGKLFTPDQGAEPGPRRLRSCCGCGSPSLGMGGTARSGRRQQRLSGPSGRR